MHNSTGVLHVVAVLLLSLGAATVSGKAADAPLPRRTLTADDLYNIQTITDPQVSPDGQWVAYVVSTNDRAADESRSAIWMVSWDGTQQVRLTNPAHGTSSPRWSPDGRYISYIATPGGSRNGQIMLLDRRGGEARALTSLADHIESYEWSADSKRLVMVMERVAPSAGSKRMDDGAKPIVIDSLYFKEDNYGYLGAGHNRHLYLLDVENGRIEPLTNDAAFNEDLPAWSPDGRRIAFVRTQEKRADPDGRIDIDVIDARPGAQVTRLVRIYVPYHLLSNQKMAWSLDGRTLAFLQGQESRYNQYSQDRLAIVNAAGGSPQSVSDSLDRNVISYVFNRSSTSITAIIEDDGTTSPVVINTLTHSVRKLAQVTSVVSNLSTANGHTVVLSSSDASAPEVFALESEHLRKLTKHNDAYNAGLQLGTVEDMRFNSADGTPIHGLFVKPPNFEPGRRYPALLWIHGGPNEQDQHSYGLDDNQFNRQLLAAKGFVVAGVNYRGSSGRGDAFAHAIVADWGHKEVEDLLAGVDYLVRQGVADPEKLGIGGWSYGGMLTDYTIATDTRFKAALSGAGTGNPLGLYGVDQYYIQYHHELGDPWRNTEVYIKLAYPLLHADRIHTPTLFMGGDRDVEVPIVGGEQMYLALRTLGVPTQLIVYPGEYHSLARPSFQQDHLERMTAWFSQYLLAPAH